MTSQQPVITIEGIQKRYANDLFGRSSFALEVSGRFHAGRSCALLGHNGSGKTTTIRIMLGLLKADHGRVLFGDVPISHSHRSRVGFMPETNKLPLRLTAEEVLNLQLTLMDIPRIERRQRVEEILRELGMWEERRKTLSQLSKGMGRKIAWGVASIHTPDVLILDEPFSGLDPLERQRMVGWIQRFKSLGASIILSTHELSTVKELADDLLILRQGKVALSSAHLIPDEEILVHFVRS